MKKYLLVLVVAVMLLVKAPAQKCVPDPGFWADFKIAVGQEEINLSIFRSTDGTITGNCRFIKDVKNVFAITGAEENCSYHLNMLNAKKELRGEFTFQYLVDKVKKTELYNGIYIDSSNKQVAVQPKLASMVGGSDTQRYLELSGTTAEVEAFAEKIKWAFINNDKKWLAANCRYPVPYAGFKKTLKTEKDFLDNYDKLFSKNYRDRFKKIKCYNMFSNHMGALMGAGEVRINNAANTAKEKNRYCISGFDLLQ